MTLSNILESVSNLCKEARKRAERVENELKRSLYSAEAKILSQNEKTGVAKHIIDNTIEFIDNALGKMSKYCREFGDIADTVFPEEKEKARETSHSVAGGIDKFRVSMRKAEVKSIKGLIKVEQYLGDMSKDLGKKLENLGTKFATAVKDLFKGMENLAKSAVKALSKERSVAGQTTKKSHIEAMEKQKASKDTNRGR